MDPFWGEPIHVYTRAQAIADGVLVDVTELARTWFGIDVVLTAAVADGLDDAGKTRLLVRTRAAIALNPAGDRVYFAFDDRQLWARMHPGDQGEAVLTIMLVGED